MPGTGDEIENHPGRTEAARGEERDVMRAIFIMLVVLLASAAISCNMAGKGQTTGRMEREPRTSR